MGADAEWLAGTLMPAPGKCEKRAEGEREGVRGLGRAEARAADALAVTPETATVHSHAFFLNKRLLGAGITQAGGDQALQALMAARVCLKARTQQPHR